jgi:tetratricopeptide (TPR) repeat protein
MFAEGTGQLPFDVAPLRALPYRIGDDGKPAGIPDTTNALVERLQEARKAIPDSPLFQLVEGFPDIQRLKTDVFRDRMKYSEEMKKQLTTARKEGVDAVRSVEKQLGIIKDSEAAVVIDLFLSYRAVKAWDDMIELVQKMASPLAATIMVQEQLGLALNRAGRSDEAEKVLMDLISDRGPSSETYGILGRVYKDRWEAAVKAGDDFLARGLLTKAIESYLKGFQADWRDAYPGINAVTLMELQNPPDSRRLELIPVVRYANQRRIQAGKPDYWDYATQLELAVLAKDEATAASALSNALPNIREKWEPETTARNLHLIRKAREKRNDNIPWATTIENELNKKAQ